MPHTSGSEADVIVIGVGTCGEDLSLRLLSEGLSVIGVEAALVGGECAYWACIPSKMVIRAANAVQEARRVDGLAGQASVSADWGPVAERIRNEASGGWDDSIATQRFQDRGGRLIHGRGRLTAPRTVEVNGETLHAKRGVVIATGSSPAVPPIEGLTGSGYWTTHDVISMETPPDSLLILGGGPIGCELGQALARFGVAVTIVEAASRILPAEEPEASAVLTEALTAEGIALRTGAAVQRVTRTDGGFTLTLQDGGTVSGERLLVATGRRVELDALGLEAAGVRAGRFIEIDERCRAADGVWAMGDVTGKGMFTHVAGYQATVIAADILGEPHGPARYEALPRVTFTDPEVGSVGLTEAAAVAAGRDVVVAVKNVPNTFRGWLHRTNGVVKLVADRESGVLVGGTACGPHGGEVLGVIALAVHAGLRVDDLREMIYPFPAFYGAVGEAVGAFGRGLATMMDPSYPGFVAPRAAGR